MSSNLITILGPTATGKTRLAAGLASLFNGEIISADSRQVYTGMDIGTGKDYNDYITPSGKIPYHLIDIISPEKEYNLYLYKKDFLTVYSEIRSRSKTPFLAGGTGMYLSAVIQNYKLNTVSDKSEFEKLSLHSEQALKQMLIRLKPEQHNETDLLDKNRIIQAILVAKAEKESYPDTSDIKSLVLGVNPDREIIKQRITARLKTRLAEGMVDEVKGLLEKGISKERLLLFGLEYKYITHYLTGELNYNDMFQKLNSAIHSFAKRQMTWFRKMEKEGVNIHWLNSPDLEKASQIIKENYFADASA